MPYNFLFKKWLLSFLLFCFVMTLSIAQEKKVREKKLPESERSFPDSISEMIDIGYGFLEKQSITGSVSAVKSDDFTKGNVNRPEQLIQGKVNMEYSSSFTTEKVAKNAPVMDAEQWRALSAEVGAGTDFGSTTDWFDEIEQTDLSHAHPGGKCCFLIVYL